MTLLLLVLAGPAHAATLVVDPTDSAAHATISDAVTAANSGDTISVAAGTYAECVDSGGKNLTFEGPSSGSPATLDGTGLCTSALVVQSGESVTVRNLALANAGGRGLYFSASTVELEGVTVDGAGAADVSGGAVRGESGTLATSTCSFSNNMGDEGGAIYLADGVEWTDTGSTFTGNTSVRSGGAVFGGSNHAISLSATQFDSNTAGLHGGAIAASWYSSLRALEVVFTSNTAGESGGAVYTYVVTGDLRFEDSTFTANEALTGWGGAIEVEWYSLLEVIRSTFDANRSANSGGAVSQWYETSGICQDSTFTNNDARSSGGAWYFNPYQGRADDLTVTGSTFTDNIAESWGGGLFGAWARDVVVEDSTFDTNTASGAGGGLAVYVATDVSMQRNRFCGNEASYGAGAQVEWADADSISNTLFIDNHAERGGGLFRYASYAGTSEYNTFVGNSADLRGGAYLDEWGASTLDNSAFFHNVGGALFTEFSGTAGSTPVRYDAWGDNAPIDGTGYFQVSYGTDGNVTGDPLFAHYTPGGPCAEQDLRPAAGSVLIDAADPGDRDRNGTPADIGAYGGPSAPLEDHDGDGIFSDSDCLDGDATVMPGIDEVCDGIDNNCDGVVDGPSATDATAWFLDADGDGFGDPATEALGCGGSGMVTDGTDCDDTDGAIHPAATERWYDGVDSDCGGRSDFDADGDGYIKLVGDNGGTDCDDTDPTTNPGADDIPNDGIDQNCDGVDYNTPDPIEEDPDSLESGDSDDDKSGGCNAAGGLASGAVWLLLPWLARRRRGASTVSSR